MQCSTCGNELGAQALFCGKCGTPVVADEAASEGTLEAKGLAAQRRRRGARAAGAAEVTGAVSDTPAVSSRASFKGAMDSSHKKARRKMPVLVLMALFMLAASAIAWATYTLIHPALVNEREIDWTPEALYEAMDPDRFNLEARLAELLALAREPSVRVVVPRSIAEPEGDRLNFVYSDDEEAQMVIYYLVPNVPVSNPPSR